jgi:hypothetical protein
VEDDNAPDTDAVDRDGPVVDDAEDGVLSDVEEFEETSCDVCD